MEENRTRLHIIYIILVNVDSRQGDLGGWSSLLYTPITAYHIQQYWDAAVLLLFLTQKSKFTNAFIILELVQLVSR